MPEDERGESKLLEYTAEDDPVLSRPKLRKGEGAASPKAVSSRIPKEIPSPIGQSQEHGRKKPQEKLSNPY